MISSKGGEGNVGNGKLKDYKLLAMRQDASILFEWKEGKKQ